MKHTLQVTFLLLGLFIGAQLIGLYITKRYTAIENLPYNIERPEFEKETSYIPLFSIILIATLIAIIMAKFKAVRLWKFWFFLSVWLTLIIAFGAFVNQNIALVLGLGLAYLKTFRQNVIAHNFSELFIYGGFAAIFVPVLSVLSISILLILIAIYDGIAVWKTKHMIKLAKFQTNLKIFAGLLIPYGKKEEHTAILGGGDIGFPLLFSGVMLVEYGWLRALTVTLFVSIALLWLLLAGEKNKFYPAMPFIAAGCFAGYFVGLLF